jgi:DNA-binding response OmpR family regulator
MQALWNDEQFVDDNTLTVNVNRLRRKITGIGLEDFIVTRKGMGYLIE